MKFNQLFITITLTGLLYGASSIVAEANEQLSCSGKQYYPQVIPDSMSVSEKKTRFRCLVQGEIDSVYTELNDRYLIVRNNIRRNKDDNYMQQLRSKYRVESNQDLLLAIKPHPKSIAIAQAALESAWGTSRFFQEANNLFGIRAATEYQPRIAANGKGAKKTVWLRKYESIKESIIDYYFVLSRGNAFKEFRRLSMKTSDPHQLVKELDQYSERKNAYVQELSSMIRFNQFQKLD